MVSSSNPAVKGGFVRCLNKQWFYTAGALWPALKTANLFSYKFTDSKELTDEIRRLNGVYVPKGLRIVILSTSENRALIYAYRISKLREDFKDRLANSMLTRRSYSVDCPETCIKQLAEKIRPGCDFPHEIGLFLGYPPEDVYGFITNHTDCAKCVGPGRFTAMRIGQKEIPAV